MMQQIRQQFRMVAKRWFEEMFGRKDNEKVLQILLDYIQYEYVKCNAVLSFFTLINILSKMLFIVPFSIVLCILKF